jgi:hypothetical protein
MHRVVGNRQRPVVPAQVPAYVLAVGRGTIAVKRDGFPHKVNGLTLHQKWKIASTTDRYWPRLAGSAKRDRPIDVEVAPLARLITPR